MLPRISNIRSHLVALASARPVFHSEADFRHALAWQIQTAYPTARVRLETRPTPGVRLDALVTLGKTRMALELKYPLRNLVTRWDGEEFNLPNQSAQDTRRYDFIKDIERLERIVPKVADVGYAVALTNDPNYWQPTRRQKVNDMAFRLHEGREIASELEWDAATGAKTKEKREAVLSLVGSYLIQWHDFSEVEGVGYTRFRYTVVKVGSKATVPAVRDFRRRGEKA